MQVVIGILGAIVGSMFVMKTEWFLVNLGRIEWAEQKLLTLGGSRMLYKLTGILIAIASIMYMTGLLFPFIVWFLGFFIPSLRTPTYG